MTKRTEIERDLIGLALSHPDYWVPILGPMLKNYDFSGSNTSQNARTWEALLHLGANATVERIIDHCNGLGLGISDISDALSLGPVRFYPSVATTPELALGLVRPAVRTLLNMAADEKLRDTVKELSDAMAEPNSDPHGLILDFCKRVQSITKMSGNGLASIEIDNAADLVGMDIPDARWIVNNLLPEGAVILAGKPKAGKSWLALNIAVAVAHGTAALNTRPTEQGSVLYLALEDNRRRMKQRLKLSNAGTPNRMDVAYSWPKIGDGGAEAIAEWIEQHPDARMVVVDTLARITPPRRKNQDSYASDYETMATLAGLAMKHNICILILTHVRKGEITSPENVIDEVSGTLGKSGAADAILALTRNHGGPRPADGYILATLQGRGRDFSEDIDQQLEFDATICTWLDQGSSHEARMTHERQAVMDVLREQGADSEDNGLTPKELSELLDKPAGTIRRLLRQMVNSSQVLGNNRKYYVR